jgi:RNA polymerase sigma-54 factor
VRVDDDLPSLEATASRPETLVEHLMWQVRCRTSRQIEERSPSTSSRSLSAAGYLRDVTVPQIARRSGYSPLQVEQVLRRMQSLDPLSIAARNLAEALWIQVNHPDEPIDRSAGARPSSPSTSGTSRSKAYPAIARDMGERSRRCTRPPR